MKPRNPPRPLLLVDELPRAGQPAEALVQMWQDLERWAIDESRRPETVQVYVPAQHPVKVRYGLD